MKLVRHYLESIDGIEIFGIIGFLLFFLVFILLSIQTFRIKESVIDKWSSIPFDDNSEAESGNFNGNVG